MLLVHMKVKSFLAQKWSQLKQSCLSLHFFPKGYSQGTLREKECFSPPALHFVNTRGLEQLRIAPLTHFLLHIFCSIIVTTVQYLSPALHKNFTDADFDFKVCDFD